MKLKNIIFGLTVLVFTLCFQSSFADNVAATQSMVKILQGMKHFPSDAEKEMLMDISKDSSVSDGLRIIATSIYNFKHSVNDQDKMALRTIIAEEDTLEVEKILAQIVIDMNHSVGDEAKSRLAALE